MWDTAQVGQPTHLSHDMPCMRCGHAPHRFLACGDGCECRPVELPADQRLLTV